ncbi:hypothetical protein [Streptomyces fuscichromogenes]|uniref:Uncharacterized protein n=1 Tax=Streptomyces fuscichromogenes TaxID=1324013 RepID=A0A918CX41_9ACTN|nr:hypothetical protein [Streptomyces fuscichromogenes]GGN42226.1 hypothetical protein GCM10011578_091350 [Streptomyces fuscichromogenes]
MSFADPAASVRGHAELNSLISRTPVITDYRVGRYHVTFDHLLYRWDTNFADGTSFGVPDTQANCDVTTFVTALTGDESGCSLVVTEPAEVVRCDKREVTVANESATDMAAAARLARFGKLPERVQFHEMVEERKAVPSGAEIISYNPEGSWNHFSCLASDLGL